MRQLRRVLPLRLRSLPGTSFTLFLTREGFDESAENQGFLPLEGRKVLVRLDGKVFEADLDGQNDLPADVETFILTVLKNYAYLL